MKIQKITQTPIKFGQIQFNNPNNTIDKSISEETVPTTSVYNNFGVKLPYFIFHKRPVIPVDMANDIVMELKSSVFRDDELFDENRDEDDLQYRMYNPDDILAVNHSNNTVDADYYIIKGSEFNINKEFETNIAFPNNEKLLEDDITKITKHKEISTNAELNKLSYLNKGIKDVFSIKLNDALIEKRSYSYSLDTIKTVTQAATLINSSNCEHVDYDLFEAGFDLADSYCVGSIDDTARLMRASVLKDEEGNEYYSKDMMSLLQTTVKHFSVNDTIDLCSRAVKYKRGEGQYCSTAVIKQLSKQFTDLFENDK